MSTRTRTTRRTRTGRVRTAAAMAAAAAALLPFGGGTAEAAAPAGSVAAPVAPVAPVTSAESAASAAPAAASAPAVPAEAPDLPEGVVTLADGPCPKGMLCLYRDINRGFPAYAIREGHDVDLRKVPMKGVSSDTAANNVSSWNNNTGSRVRLVDDGTRTVRTLRPLDSQEETLRGPHVTNDTVDRITWVRSDGKR